MSMNLITRTYLAIGQKYAWAVLRTKDYTTKPTQPQKTMTDSFKVSSSYTRKYNIPPNKPTIASVRSLHRTSVANLGIPIIDVHLIN